MKITPLEIRQKSFEKKLRGYDKDEVNAFLVSLSNEWERALDEHKELRIKLDHAEKEVQKLREVESSLFKTLKTAEDTGANLVNQANKAAELHLRETHMNAEAIMSEARSKAKNMIEKAEMEAKHIIEEMQEGVKELEQSLKTLENHRENILTDLKNFSEGILERISRFDNQKKSLSSFDYSRKIKELVRESEERINSYIPEHQKKVTKKIELPKAKSPQPPVNSSKKPVAVQSADRKTNEGASASFFDQLED